MSYHLYRTRGFILENLPVGESDKAFYIFSEELGFILATAKSARATASKLRPHLNDLTLSELSLIRGKSRWKITGARSLSNLYTDFSNSTDKLLLCARVFALLKKLMGGEEVNEQLFSILQDGVNALKSGDYSKEELLVFECILLSRILNNLGFLKLNPRTGETLVGSIDKKLIGRALSNKKFLLRDINQALRASER